MNASLRIAAAAALVLGLAGCEVFKRNEETVGTVNQRVVGMAAGDFFERYGRPRWRAETADGGAEYLWESPTGPVGPGFFANTDERICRMRLSADRRGRIATVVIQYDGPGRTGTSRCREIFSAA
jgi:hypothetical protein